MKSIFQLSSASIKKRLQTLTVVEQRRACRFAQRILLDGDLKKDEKLRSGAVRLIVARLPQTFPVLKKLLADCESPYWYEIQFTMFCALDRNDLTRADQTRVLRLINDYLLRINSNAGFAAWKAGDLLGDEWRDSETVGMLEKLLFSARHATGRKAALHGIEHALKDSKPAERERLFSLIRKAAKGDRSENVRRSARLTLEGIGCGPTPTKSDMHAD